MTTRKFVFVDLKGNSNKFWNVTDNGDSWTVNYGRVGYAGATETYSHVAKSMSKTISSKIKKGYTEVQTIDAGKTVAVANVAAVAKQQIQVDNGCKETARLVELLTKKNQHNILATTKGISFTNGQVTTPMGMITDDTIQRARQVLARVASNPNDLGLVSDYLRLVPMNIGHGKNARRNPLAGQKAVDEQNALLDALEAAVAAGVKTATAGADKVFDVKLTKVDEKTMAYIVDKFNRSVNGLHVSSNLKPVRAWEVEMQWDNRVTFANDGLKIGNVRKLWHGHGTANLLSILEQGSDYPACDSGALHGTDVRKRTLLQ
jgi:predicted DNA-binding WGR domain protein